VASDIPAQLQAMIADGKGNTDAAIRIWKSELEKAPKDEKVMNELVPLLLKINKADEVIELVHRMPNSYSNKTYHLLRAKAYDHVIAVASERLAEAPSDWVARINRAIAYKRIGKPELMEIELRQLESDQTIDAKSRVVISAGMAALRGNLSAFKERFAEALNAGAISRKAFEEYPVFDDVRLLREIQLFVRAAVLARDEKRKGTAANPTDAPCESAAVQEAPEIIRMKAVTESAPLRQTDSSTGGSVPVAVDVQTVQLAAGDGVRHVVAAEPKEVGTAK
jgi:hypothetical protein